MTTKTRYVCILLVALFVCSSLAAPNLFVLCTGEGDTARIEPFHRARTARVTGSAHQCGHSDGSVTDIAHNHVRCTDFSLSGHLGLIKERVRLPELPCFWTSASPVGNGDLDDARAAGASMYPAPIHSPAHHFLDVGLESVILIL